MGRVADLIPEGFGLLDVLLPPAGVLKTPLLSCVDDFLLEGFKRPFVESSKDTFLFGCTFWSSLRTFRGPCGPFVSSILRDGPEMDVLLAVLIVDSSAMLAIFQW